MDCSRRRSRENARVKVGAVDRASLPEVPPSGSQKTLARRILVSFAITLVAFAITCGWSVESERRAALDNEELAKGYVPVASNFAQLRSTQATIATLVGGIPDERDPLSTRILLTSLTNVRREKFAATRSTMTQRLNEYGSSETRQLALYFVGDLDSIEAQLAEDRRIFEELFAALDTHQKDDVNRLLVTLGTLEHEADKRIKTLSDKIASSMDELSARAYARERRAIYALFALAILTLGVGVAVSLNTRKLLAPLARVTERARAVAHGDLAPHDVDPTPDEIGELAVAFERMVAAVAREQNRAVSNERLAAIGKMAAHVTHEIRNPLSSIGLNIEMLDEELAGKNVGGESRALLQAITREVERLEHLSEEYLRVARLPSPRMEADDVAAAVTEIVSFARPEIVRAGCTITLHVDEALPPALFDESQIRQALINLLRNAREAMPAGGAIEVRVVADGMSLVVSIADRGGGIPDAIRARVFDPFFSTKGEGTGLGLAITQQIVEAHGGSIACDAREGGGTVFRVSLPIAPSRVSGSSRTAKRSRSV
jgi:two-component system NtrC family sensor kinase